MAGRDLSRYRVITSYVLITYGQGLICMLTWFAYLIHVFKFLQILKILDCLE